MLYIIYKNSLITTFSLFNYFPIYFIPFCYLNHIIFYRTNIISNNGAHIHITLRKNKPLIKTQNIFPYRRIFSNGKYSSHSALASCRHSTFKYLFFFLFYVGQVQKKNLMGREQYKF